MKVVVKMNQRGIKLLKVLEIILKNGGKVDIKDYKTCDGYSSSYIIDLI